MAWYARITRYLSAHMVYSQQKQNSCGIACIMMINFKMKKKHMLAGVATEAALATAGGAIGAALGVTYCNSAIDNAVKSEPHVYAEYTKVTGSPYDGSSYSDADQFPAVLANLGLGKWECVDLGEKGVGSEACLSDGAGAPMIALVEWKKGGSHFVLVDGYTRNSGLVCDPWDGEVHVTPMPFSRAITYNAGDAPLGWSLSSPIYNYPKGETGKFNGVVVRRKR
ncbi:hypothetical protein [Muricoccus radiodurans]|uniref:hypothetical protein n=1 Tax=Muricoccus radiodurans TaxID=2231721 RepID=UPI003CFBB04F